MVDPTILLDKDSRQLGLNMYLRIRQDSENLCKPLQTEDYISQTAMYASPAKWHLAHVTWFFEMFILTVNTYQVMRFSTLNIAICLIRIMSR